VVGVSGRLVYYERGGTVYALLDPAQFSDDHVRLAVALRNEATVAGACPSCGATAPMPNRAARRRAKGTVQPLVFEHEAGCPVSDDGLLALIAKAGEAA